MTRGRVVPVAPGSVSSSDFKPTGQSAKRRRGWISTTPQSRPQYRAQIRAWLDEHKAQAPVLQRRGALTDATRSSTRAARGRRKLAEAGLAGVTWPKEYGGQGVGPLEQVIVNQEIAPRAACPGILDVIGVGMLGPTIIAHGTDEQKQRYLGPMLHGDEVWCQLFCEPAAGSDLAGVQTRAKRNDDGTWTLNGPEGVDDERAVRRLRPAARAHRTPTCPSTRA